VTLALCLLAATLTANADPYPPRHECNKPAEPFRLASDWERENHAEAMREYARCLQEFIEEQQEAAEAHRQAAQEALDEWNRNVRAQLH
jgi:hypothetical protein